MLTYFNIFVIEAKGDCLIAFFFMPILGRARPADRWVLESLWGSTWKILCCGLFRGVLMGFRGLQSRKNGWPEGCLWTWGSKKFGEREVFSSVRKTGLHGVKKLCGLVDKILLHFRYVGVVSYIILKMVLWVCNLWTPKNLISALEQMVLLRTRQWCLFVLVDITLCAGMWHIRSGWENKKNIGSYIFEVRIFEQVGDLEKAGFRHMQGYRKFVFQRSTVIWNNRDLHIVYGC